MSSITKDVQKDEFNVMVTGFAPFSGSGPVNLSWEIAHRLPSYVPSTAISSQCKDNLPPEDIPSIRISVNPDPVKVSYKEVRELIPKLWGLRRIDLMVHIGVAANRNFYSVERLAHRDGYLMPDVDGKVCSDLTERMSQGKDWIWYGLPEKMVTDIELDDTLSKWKLSMPGVDVRISEDPGRYLCDFIYYSSLAELRKKGQKRRVVFLHVPVEADEKTINLGVDATLQLIKSIVNSELACESYDPLSRNKYMAINTATSELIDKTEVDSTETDTQNDSFIQ